MFFSLFPFVPEILVSRDGLGSPLPHQPPHLKPQAEYSTYLRDSPRVPQRRPFINLNRHTPSGQSRVYLVTQLRTDGVHCRESAGTGPVVSKVVPNGCCLGRSPWTNQYAPLFPTPTIGMRWACSPSIQSTLSFAAVAFREIPSTAALTKLLPTIEVQVKTAVLSPPLPARGLGSSRPSTLRPISRRLGTGFGGDALKTGRVTVALVQCPKLC